MNRRPARLVLARARQPLHRPHEPVNRPQAHRLIDSRPAAVLQLGASGPAVRSLQSELARLSYLSPGAIDGSFGMATWEAVVAFQGWSGLSRDGVAGPATRRALARAGPPRPWSAVSGIEVHIPQQVLLLVSDGHVQRAIHISSGRPGWPTPVGHFSIGTRVTMSWSRRFHVWMPLAQYFYGGYALHELADVPAYPASHGCVRIPETDAATVWGFGAIGMRVWTSA